MRTPLILRASLSLVALGAALAAQAFSVSSVGTFALDADPNLFTQDETVFVSRIGSTPALSSLPALTSLHVSGVYDPFTTTAVYSSGSGTLTIDLAYVQTVVGGIGVSTDSGLWTILSGTGSYTNLVGGGSYSINYNANDDNFSQTTLVGDVQAVPEPASIAALSVGALALLRRRKKA